MTGEHLAYYRKSIGRAGISRQRTSTTGHVDKLGGTIIAEFPDTDSTAYRDPLAPLPPRPKFDAMLAEMARRPGVTVAAWHVDRLGRDPETTEVLIRACMAGRHLITTARGGDYDVLTATGRKRLRDDINDAAFEVDHNRERVLLKMAELRAEGRWGGGRRPFGWDVDGDSEGGLVLREAEAALIRSGTAGLLAGQSLSGIGRDWAAVTGRKWDHVLVRQVLVRPLNAGLVSLAGEVTGPGRWPAIVSEPEWRAVRALVADPSRRTGPGPERRHLLSGVALCGTCGRVLGIAGSGGAPTYRCRYATRKLPAPDARHAARSIASLDAFVTALALGRLRREDARLLLRADHGADRKALLAAEAAEQAEHEQLWQLRKARAITDRELIEGRAGISERLEGIRGQLAALDAADVLAPMVADPDGAWGRAAVDLRRSVVAALMYVTVFPARMGRPAGTPRQGRWFDAESVDVRWVRPLPSDG